MKTFRIARWILPAVIAGAVLSASAQPERGPDREGPRAGAPGRAEGERIGRVREEPGRPEMSPDQRAEQAFQRLVDELDLDRGTRREVRGVWREHRQAVARWNEQHGEQLRQFFRQMRNPFDGLELTDEQREKIRRIVREHRSERPGQSPERGSRGPRGRGDGAGRGGEPSAEAWRQAARARWQAAREIEQQVLSEPQRRQLHRRREEFRKLMESRRPLVEEFIEKLDEALTDEQMARARKILRPRGPAGGGPWQGPGPEDRPEPRGLHALRDLDLTDEQAQQVRRILEETRQRAAEADPQDRRETLRDAVRRIHQDVLTPQQRLRLRRMHGGPRERGPRGRRPDEQEPQGRRPAHRAPHRDERFGHPRRLGRGGSQEQERWQEALDRLELSPVQREAVDEAVDQLDERVEREVERLRREAWQDVREQIERQILTDRQRERLEELMARTDERDPARRAWGVRGRPGLGWQGPKRPRRGWKDAARPHPRREKGADRHPGRTPRRHRPRD